VTPEQIAELLDVGVDSTLAQHVTLTNPYPDVYVIVPRHSLKHDYDSPVAQCRLATDCMLRMIDRDIVKTVCLDGVTNLANSLTDQFAREKTNKVDTSKHWELFADEDDFVADIVVPGVNWSDNGMSQRTMVMQVREPLLRHHKSSFHLFLLGHEVEKNGFIGMDAGGPANMRKFPGGSFTNWFYLDKDNTGDRMLLTQSQRVRGPQVLATFKKRVGMKPDERFFDEDGTIRIPDLERDYSGGLQYLLDMWDECLRVTGTKWFRAGITGPPDAGKSTLFSTFIATAERRPVVIFMADNQGELPTYVPDALGIEVD
jgi:hypothetical protein